MVRTNDTIVTNESSAVAFLLALVCSCLGECMMCFFIAVHTMGSLIHHWHSSASNGERQEKKQHPSESIETHAGNVMCEIALHKTANDWYEPTWPRISPRLIEGEHVESGDVCPPAQANGPFILCCTLSVYTLEDSKLVMPSFS